ncbi:hypothetical protein B7P43_G06970 [Cryptotermes secundus]|uniref:Reverse transcriptase domain-containing protein n=1 Tax=Cryptotermes secundus TaxID=105785 RepID=A0A2J7RLG0_9NEOP|nr:uncharacterized protein LOC111871640 isoform X1 [Cryptotermes secundus]XP_023720656.1 uncharacterized protein LOC111871640 isoform X1 [Cryptotermes secundus]XP_033610265.1 uncharacterized protein LOC111871640 isoform X1 [Cryptotermes secundus]XP_033610270.1 uncharacterized protein LOC111871640 isoform X1 [Cryptotermes secundus]PNF41670.1 hypothetical protein B7P43_G06970 [Cryptotermes secundus]PNF41671.1 hypothetical protein B7P43_G06970 [Cryptotermes secundus]
MITNKIFYPSVTNVMEMWFSDHFAVVMDVTVNLPSTSNIIIKRVFSRNSIDMFNCHLASESWNEVYSQSDVNRAYSYFLSKFTMYFNRFFPLKEVSRKKGNKVCWITKGIKVSRQKLQLLRLLKRKLILSASALNYIKKYQSTYKKILFAARKRANDRIIANSSNSTKALWNIIKIETGKGCISNPTIAIEIGSVLVTNPQLLSYHFNDHFVEIVDRMCTHTKDIRQVCVPANKMFVAPITEEEVLNVTGKLKNKYSSGFDEILVSLIKHCIQFINKLLTFIFNLSLNTGTFPNLMKIAKVRPILKKGRIQDITNYN